MLTLPSKIVLKHAFGATNVSISAEEFTRDLFQDQRKSGKGMREAIAMANQAFHLELNVSI